MGKIFPVILAGGSGTRLWPVSRYSYPKQFGGFLGDTTLFQDTAARLSGSDCLAEPVIVTNSDYRFVVVEQLDALNLVPSSILIEPDARGTAPAVLAAAFHLHARDPEAIMLVAPSDHHIPDIDAFSSAVKRGLPAAAEGKIVLFGVPPERPETGYGYLEVDTTDAEVVPVRRFVEKPDAETAARMLGAGTFLWHAGIFLFRVKDVLAYFDKYAPELVAPARASVEGAEADIGFLRLAPLPWETVADISIDYAVLEKADSQELAVVPFTGGWSDLGDWDSIWRHMEKAGGAVNGNGRATAIDCEGSLLRSDSDSMQVVGLGLKDIVAVAMKDAVLVASKDRLQDVTLAVSALKDKQAKQAIEFPMDHRPWGNFESLATGGRFQVKRIQVRPGAALSLQSHCHRSEHWIVVEGTARVTIDNEVKLVTENESVYIPLGARHRLENPGKLPMVLIEVQTGAYVGEDDIIRYEDVYARGQGAKG